MNVQLPNCNVAIDQPPLFSRYGNVIPELYALVVRFDERTDEAKRLFTEIYNMQHPRSAPLTYAEIKLQRCKSTPKK